MNTNILPLLIILFIAISQSTHSQESKAVNDTTSQSRKWLVEIDVQSRYIWRGQSWGGNYPVIQPAVYYNFTEKFYAGIWATTNFQRDYFYKDGITGNKGYQEVDFGIGFQATDFLLIELWDYYWPTWKALEDVDQNYFNYGPDSVQSVDLTLTADFSEGYRYAFVAILSTLVAGNDFRYEAEVPKQNFTTYAELGYRFSDALSWLSPNLLKDIELYPLAGAVLNNKAEYYTYADYNKVSVVNLSIAAKREIVLGSGITMPLSITYTHNAASANTEQYGRSFLVAAVSLSY